jgi:hypothetical protein
MREKRFESGKAVIKGAKGMYLLLDWIVLFMLNDSFNGTSEALYFTP